MLAAVVEIVFQVAAFGFENVVVLIFDLPASPAISPVSSRVTLNSYQLTWRAP